MKLQQFNILRALPVANRARYRKHPNAWFDLLRLYALMESEAMHGVLHINVESNAQTDDIVRVYIGFDAVGIVAHYDALNNVWYECASHGNYGKNPASGGTWSSLGKTDTMPDVLTDLLRKFDF